MGRDYFHELGRLAPTRMWVNNPTLDEARQAIAAGGISCTTNPTFCSNMLRRDTAFAESVIDGVMAATADNEAAAHRVQQEMVRRIVAEFLPVYRAGARLGWQGVVSVQGDPRRDTDADHIVQEAIDDRRRLGTNFIAKVPVTAAGLKAIERLIHENCPVVATEVFGLSQAVAAGDTYERASKACGKAPPFFLTHITGIYDEYLARQVAERGIQVSPRALEAAGCALCRRQYALVKERGYRTIMLGGGARSTRHFTEFVGGDVHITINWSTAEEIFALGVPPTPRMDAATDPQLIAELLAALPDFRRAWEVDGLAVEEFADFGPVQYFRDMFIKGWDHLLATIRDRRK